MMLTLENSFSLYFIFTDFRWFYCFNWLGVLNLLFPQYSSEPRPLGFCFVVIKSCSTLCNPTECSLTGSFVHRISQARRLEGIAISFSRGSSWPMSPALKANSLPLSHQENPGAFAYCFLNFNVSKWWCILLRLSVDLPQI